MEPSRLIEALRRPDAFPHPSDEVRVIHTHISVVFLAGEYAYKVKKPLDLGFLDFTTLERRRHFCHEEVRLNRRLAPRVYVGVVPLVERDGEVVVPERVEAEEDAPRAGAVEYAVKMLRLPPDATLHERLPAGRLEPAVLDDLARRVAGFHREAASGPEVSRFGRWEAVAGNARDNLTQARDQVGATLSAGVHARLERALEDELAALRPLIEDRARRDRPRDTHGDLHLDHVYLFPERDPPDDLVIIDCIEFSERFRYADTVSDMAFLAMDLIHHGRRDLERRFSTSYFEAAEDPDGVRLLPFYRSYRAAVRGKVEGMVRGEEVPAEEREAARASARGHWLLALGELEPPERRPGLVLVGGLPGTGKSTVADGVAGAAGFEVISSDRTRKALAGVAEGAGAGADFEQGIYTSAWTRKTYGALLERAGEGLFEGERILIDATFADEENRRAFLELARAHGVRTCFLQCRADSAVVRDRLERRGAGTSARGASDADWEVHRRLAERWDEPSPGTRRALAEVDTGGAPEAALEQALAHLERVGLTGAGSP